MSDQTHSNLDHVSTARLDLHVDRCSECDGHGEIASSRILVGSYYSDYDVVSYYTCQACNGTGEFLSVTTPAGEVF